MLALKESRVLEGGGDHTLECGRGLDLLALGCIHIASIRWHNYEHGELLVESIKPRIFAFNLKETLAHLRPC